MTTRTAAVMTDDAVHLATSTDGEPDGPPVVLLHGGPGLWDYLEPLADLLAPHALVHRYDQRGGGLSEDAEPHTLPRWVADLESLRRAWGHERITVIGHSFGAGLACAYALEHPDRVAGLGYVSGVGIGDWRTPFREAVARLRTPAQAARLRTLRELHDRDPAQEREYRVLQWRIDLANPEDGAAAIESMVSSPHRIRFDINRALRVEDQTQVDALTRLRLERDVPVAIVHGARDPRPWQTSRALAEQVQATYTLLDRSGHLPWVEQPGDLTASLTALLPRR